MTDQEVSSRFLRLAPLGVAALAAVIPVGEVVYRGLAGDDYKVWWGVLAAGCYLPLFIHVVLHAARGSTPARPGWLFATITVVVLGAIPLVGAPWLVHLWVVTVAALALLPQRWSVPTAVGVVALTAPLALALGEPAESASWMFFGASIWRVAFVFALVWLVGALQKLHEARHALAERAVAAERARIDREVTLNLGTALESTMEQGRRAADILSVDAETAIRELRALVARSRQTLAEARQMISGYQQASMAAELDTAVTLLAAAGVEARLVLPRGDLPKTVDISTRSALRSATAELLSTPDARSCVIIVSRRNGRLQINLDTDDGAARSEVAA